MALARTVLLTVLLSVATVGIVSPATAQISVRLPDTSVSVSEPLQVPVRASDLSGQNVLSYEFTVEYDETVFSITGVEREGTLSEGRTVVANTDSSGQATVSMGGTTPLEGGGVLLYLTALPDTTGSSPLSWESFQFNEGTPSADPQDGSFTVGNLGSVGVSLPDTTGTVGDPLQIPVRVDTVTGRGIQSYSLEVQYNSSLLTVTGASASGTLSEGYSLQVDTSGSGTVSVAAAGTDPLSGSGTLLQLEVEPKGIGTAELIWGQMQFNEGTPPAQMQDGTLAVEAPPTEAVGVRLPDTSGTVGETLLLPVKVDSTGGAEITSFSFSVSYDPAVLEATGVRKEGTLSEGYSLQVDTSASGTVSVAAAGTSALSGPGTLLYLEVQAEAVGTSPLEWAEFIFNEGTPPAETQGGSLESSSLDPVLASLPDTTGTVEEPLQVPVKVDTVTGRGIQSYSLEVQYNSSLLTVTGASASGTLSEGYSLQVDTSGSGTVSVAAAGTDPLSGSGTLLQLEVEPKGIGTAELIWGQMQFNEGTPPAQMQDGTLAVEAPPTEAVGVRLPDTSGTVGETLLLPVKVDSTGGAEITSFSFSVSYDPAVLEATGVRKEGTLSEGYSLQVDTSASGTVSVAAAGTSALSGPGTLLYLEVQAEAVGTSPLEWAEFIFNEGTPPAETQGGSLEVKSSTAGISLTDGRDGLPYNPPSPTPGTQNNPVGRLRISADRSGAVLESLTLAQNGSSVAGISSIELWRSVDSTFAASEDNLLVSDTSATPATFEQIGLSIPEDTAYAFLVVDLTEEAGGDYAPVIESEDALGLENGKLEYVNGVPDSTFTYAYLSSEATPLPVELTSFEATLSKGEAHLVWQTASETRNARFEVQRRGRSRPKWRIVGSVEGGGTTSETRIYRFTDEDLPYEGERLKYRLRQVDTDGSTNLSQTVSVKRGAGEIELLGTHPNPARSQATIRYSLPKEQEATLRIYDVLGQQVRTVVRTTQSGRHKRQVDLSGLPSGTYFLRLQAGGTTKTRKLTIVR